MTMDINNSMIGDWNSLTEEEQYELYQKFENADKWLYEDNLDPIDPDEIAWHKYLLEEAKFMAEAEYYYKKYLDYKGEKKPSPELLSIFKYNTPLLNYFLNRLKEGDKKGAIAHLRAHLEEDPEYSEAWMELGKRLCTTGDTEAGYKAFNEARKHY